ncbi:hypothetical protein [Pseudomonas alabamensis]|uniref:hypothetical protein n=1 Tax=Pseudomonas alabamensis TaxID=3064349 RepID=UPI003F64AC76
MREFVNEGQLPIYLKTLAAAGAIVFSVGSATLEIGSTFKSAYDLAHIAQKHPDYFGVGPHWVDSSEGWKEKDSPEIIISGYAIAYTLLARLKRNGLVIGGYEQLLEGLSSFEYLAKSDPYLEGGVGHFIIKLPTAQSDLLALKKVLSERSICYVIADGTGFIHAGNTFMGGGLDF